MRRLTFRIVGLLLTLFALASVAPQVQAQQARERMRMCPFCIPGSRCCVYENSQRCVPETKPC